MSGFMIEEVKINGLFGYLNHEIPFKDGGVTFVHGPNGCGKTAVLRLIAAIFKWDVSALLEVDYTSIEIKNTDGSIFVVNRKEGKSDDGRASSSLNIGFKGDKERPYEFTRKDRQVRVPPSEIEEFIPSLRRVGPHEWIDTDLGERLSYPDVIDRYYDRFPSPSKKGVPDWLKNYVQKINLHFIKTQRLLRVNYSSLSRHRPDDAAVADVIQLYSNEIKEVISKKLAEQATVSQLHDRSFPERLLSMEIDESISEELIRRKYAETEEKIQKLVDAGLIDQQTNIALPAKSLQETEKKVLSLYLQDVNKKLSVFDDLQSKIEVFLDIVSQKLKTKKFSVDRSNGFKIESTHGVGGPLRSNQLSSGEQHQIVLFYELIFKAEANSLFLVDEPEISLHVDWQRQFLSDVKKIAKLGDRYFLVATHSPQIIGSHRDLAVALDEGILENE